MNSHFQLSDIEFEQQFSNCELPASLFNHEAHLRLAWIHIKKLGIEKALKTICHQLKRYVTYLDAEDKYNVTLTIAATRAVSHFMQKSTSSDFKGFIEEFPRLKSHFKELIGFHYSCDIFTLEDAKLNYLEPDLLPFS